MNSVRQLLRSLIDVEGVIGSFILSEAGGLVATDLPATFDAAAFAEAGPRIVRLADFGGSYGEPTKFFVIRFAEYKLYVRVMSGAFLGVLVSPAASMPALKAAAGVLARRVESLLASDGGYGPDTTIVPPRFDGERTSSPDMGHATRPESARRPGRAISAPPSLTSTLPSITLPEPEQTSPGTAPKRAIRFRGRTL